LLNHLIITKTENVFKKYKLIGSVEIAGHLRAYSLEKTNNEINDQNCTSYY